MSSNAPIRVVVVDDHEMFAQGLTSVLGSDPAIEVVGSAGSVESGIDAVRMHAPDVVLMDFELPDGDGAAATERIKASAPETQVVMVTSFDEEAVLVSAI
jgi:DNA-binding NarL/FixJ family response regulator